MPTGCRSRSCCASQERAPSQEDWEDLSQRLTDSQTVRLDDIATELATLAPRALFQNWSVERRLGVLGRLDRRCSIPATSLNRPTCRCVLRSWRTSVKVVQLREQLQDRPELLQALDVVLERTGNIGSWSEMHAPAHVESLKRGDYLAGVNQYIDNPGQFPDIIGGFEFADHRLSRLSAQRVGRQSAVRARARPAQ